MQACDGLEAAAFNICKESGNFWSKAAKLEAGTGSCSKAVGGLALHKMSYANMSSVWLPSTMMVEKKQTKHAVALFCTTIAPRVAPAYTSDQQHRCPEETSVVPHTPRLFQTSHLCSEVAQVVCQASCAADAWNGAHKLSRRHKQL
eukprot:1159803-Pelagomonas_calceolata.AAC.7